MVFRPRVPHPLFEWIVALMFCGMSLTIAVSPKALSSQSFFLFRAEGIDSHLLILMFFATVGAIRVLGLYANGAWPLWGPRLRAAGAALGAIVWSQMTLSVIFWAQEYGYIAVVVPIYALLAIGEIASIRRASTDGGTN